MKLPALAPISMEFSDKLIAWYFMHKRDLPWRQTQNPYAIWLSEIILQQTRVAQGMEYYYAFIESFPTVEILAKAPEQEVLKLWQGLGYYSRARNLLATAKTVCSKYKSRFPDTYEELLALKGIGPYTAAAIASFAFDLPYAVVDGNVSRVLSRVFDLEMPINSTAGKKRIQALADELIDKSQPGISNQAMIELGAVLCSPTSPQCPVCPVQDHCSAYQHQTVSLRPVKNRKQIAKNRFMDFAVIEIPSGVILRQRIQADIWKGLNDFPSLEKVQAAKSSEMLEFVNQRFPNLIFEYVPIAPQHEFIHLLTHQKISARFWRFKTVTPFKSDDTHFACRIADLERIPVPRLVHKYLEKEML